MNTELIGSLIGVIIGAVLTLAATFISEYVKDRRDFQRSRLKDILIPYCTAIEDTVEAVEGYTEFRCNTPPDEMIKTMKGLKVYLKAAHRVYLSQEQRDDIEKYLKTVDNFQKNWDDYYRSVMGNLSSWLHPIVQQQYPWAGNYLDVQIYDPDALKLSLVHGPLAYPILSSISFIGDYDRVSLTITKEDRERYAEGVETEDEAISMLKRIAEARDVNTDCHIQASSKHDPECMFDDVLGQYIGWINQ